MQSTKVLAVHVLAVLAIATSAHALDKNTEDISTTNCDAVAASVNNLCHDLGQEDTTCVQARLSASTRCPDDLGEGSTQLLTSATSGSLEASPALVQTESGRGAPNSALLGATLGPGTRRRRRRLACDAPWGKVGSMPTEVPETNLGGLFGLVKNKMYGMTDSGYAIRLASEKSDGSTLRKLAGPVTISPTQPGFDLVCTKGVSCKGTLSITGTWTNDILPVGYGYEHYFKDRWFYFDSNSNPVEKDSYVFAVYGLRMTVDVRKVTFCLDLKPGETTRVCNAEKHSKLLKLEVADCKKGYGCASSCSKHDCACIFEQCNLCEATILKYPKLQDFAKEALSAIIQYS